MGDLQKSALSFSLAFALTLLSNQQFGHLYHLGNLKVGIVPSAFLSPELEEYCECNSLAFGGCNKYFMCVLVSNETLLISL